MLIRDFFVVWRKNSRIVLSFARFTTSKSVFFGTFFEDDCVPKTPFDISAEFILQSGLGLAKLIAFNSNLRFRRMSIAR